MENTSYSDSRRCLPEDEWEESEERRDGRIEGHEETFGCDR